MKLKNLTLIFLFIFTFSLAGFSQIDVPEPDSNDKGQIFNNYDFGVITEDVAEYEFIIKNSSLKKMTILEFAIPDGVGIILVDKVIEPKSDGKFIVTVNKQYMDTENKFEERIIIKIMQHLKAGVTTIIESTYIIKGSFE